MSAIAKKIKALLGFSGPRAPTSPTISQLSFKIYPIDTSTPPADGSNIGTQTIASDETKTRKALRLQRLKRKSESASVMSSTSSPCKPPSKWTASQLLQMFDYGANCRPDSEWFGVVEGKSADASRQAWRREISKAMRAALRDRSQRVNRDIGDE